MSLFVNKNIDVPNCEDKAVQIAQGVATSFDLIEQSSTWKRRKELGLDEKGMAELINRLLGSFIEEKISYMLLKHIVLEYGSKKILEAYNSLQEKTGKAVKAYFEDLVCKKNEKTVRYNKEKI